MRARWQRVYDLLIDDMHYREPKDLLPVVVINMDVKDSVDEANKCAPVVLKLCQMLEGATELEDEYPALLDQFSAETSRVVSHCIQYL